MTECWLPITGYESLYMVSDLGRVKSMRNGKVMSPGSGQDGYPIVSLYKAGQRKGVAVHRLVAEHFVAGRNPLHKEVAHLDGQRANARADNLKWVSKVENHSHKRLHGTHQAGEAHPRARLTKAQALEIRRRATHCNATALGREFGVDERHIRDIRDGKRWRSVHESAVPQECAQSEVGAS